MAAYEVFKVDGLSLAESQHINDPHLYINVKISSALLQMLTNLGPLQPVSKDLPGGEFPKSSFSGTERSFSEVYYKKETNNDTHSRQWLAYSLIVDRVYCWTCRLYGTPKAQNNIFSMTGCNDWKHLSTRLKEHESSKVHLESEISRAMYVSQNRIDLSLIRSGNTQVSKNREIVRVLMDIILYLSKYDSAFRGHNEKLLKNDSINQGKFIGLTKLLSNYHPILLVHLENMNNTDKKKRLTFTSKDSQNAMLEALAETLRDEILQKVKNAGMFSVIIDTTTDNAKIDQLAFVIRYCSDDGEVFERLVGIDEVNDSSGKGMFDVFCELCERYGLNWRKQLIGQAYDGASNMQSELKGLRGYIQAQNPCALHVWCFAHCLNLAVVDACNANEKVMNFFGTIQTLVTFLGSRKRTHLYVQCQKELCPPTQRIRRLKHFSDTRWTYHDRAIEAVQITYGAILKTLETLSNQKSNETDMKSKTLAKGLLKSLNSFEFIVIMFMMRKIFNSTTPLSNYLQSSKLDFVEAMKLVKATRNELFHLRNLGREQLLECFINETKTFCVKFELNERNWIWKRISLKKKWMENCQMTKDQIQPKTIL